MDANGTVELGRRGVGMAVPSRPLRVFWATAGSESQPYLGAWPRAWFKIKRRKPQSENASETPPADNFSARTQAAINATATRQTKRIIVCFMKLFLWIFYDVEIIYSRIFKDLNKLFIGLERYKKWNIK